MKNILLFFILSCCHLGISYATTSDQEVRVVTCKGRDMSSSLDLTFCYNKNSEEIVACNTPLPIIRYSYRSVFDSTENSDLLIVRKSEVQKSEEGVTFIVADAIAEEERTQIARIKLSDKESDSIEIFRVRGGNLLYKKAHCQL